MIESFKHKGLEKFYNTGTKKDIQANHANRLQMQLGALNTARCIEDCDLPGYNLHKLKGKRNTIWAISVNGNWRLTFEFKENNIYILNYEDYH